MIISNDKKDLSYSANIFLEEARNANNLEDIYNYLFAYISLYTINSKDTSTNNYYEKVLDIFNTYVRNSKLWKSTVNYDSSLERRDIRKDNMRILNYICGNYSDTIVNGSRIENEQLLSMVEEFYSHFDKRIYNMFKAIISDKRNALILTSEYDIKYDEICYEGETFATKSHQPQCIIINNENDLRTYITLIHEFGHSISKRKYSCLQNNPNYFYAEVESLFPEMVALYELMKDNTIAPCYHLINNIENNLDGIENITKQDALLKTWKENGYVIDEDFWKLLKDNGISTRAFKKLLKFDFYESTVYINSLKIVLKLLYVYRTNKKEALALYKNIILDSEKKKNDALEAIRSIDTIDELMHIQDSVMHTLSLNPSKKDTN